MQAEELHYLFFIFDRKSIQTKQMDLIGIAFLKILSRMPMRSLYGLSDFIFFLVYRVFKYRQSVVKDNLRQSFPEKKEDELQMIEKKFYHNLCDILVESIKMISISESELRERNNLEEHKIIDALNAKGRSCFYFMGHTGNWELSTGAGALASKVPIWGVYKKVRSREFDKLTNDYRSRFGCRMIVMEQVARETLSDTRVKNVCFIADQTPSNPKTNAWVQFLNRNTLFFTASARLAMRTGSAIVYCYIERVKRGYYKYHFETLFENASLSDEQTIIQTFASRLEQDIRRQPDNWLWSHRRWKHSDVRLG
jgi:KDO2-lipid IV(A) lauroyltransferase